MPADPNQVRDVFLAAAELSPEERPAYLAESCGGDDHLRAEVERLLAANADPDSILEPESGHPGNALLPDGTSALKALETDAQTPTGIATELHRPQAATLTQAGADHGPTTVAESETPARRSARLPTGEGIGTVIAGRYTLIELIGEGGMGSVYLASQTEPVKRQVALKLIKTGTDSRGVLARFDAERQALALMDHPNIARIYDGGLTPAGQPFFVMELVKGVPLTEYCDQKRLSITARLELFVAVCQAIQHAHQKGIIHRDLKPGNVLVTECDGRHTPKVIDFGVAKATETKLTDMSLADVGLIVGTPAYMSPEQADPTSMDIDTRTDVYALGVMLYELLTGAPPIDARQFQRGAFLEMLRMVREVDPPRPSTKLSTAEALPNIAANRSIEPARLTKLLHGELDWVVMKALEKDRSRRYETANGFARDIQRYLADEVVEARPPSRGYRLKKFVKRNKGQVIAASLLLLTLLTGIVGTSWGMWQANRGRVAERKRADGERIAKIDARARAGCGSRTARRGSRPARQGTRLRKEGPRRGRQEPGAKRLPHPGPAHPGRAGEQCDRGQGHASGSPRPRRRQGGNAVRGGAGTRTSPPPDDRDDLSRPGLLGKGRSAMGGRARSSAAARSPVGRCLSGSGRAGAHSFAPRSTGRQVLGNGRGGCQGARTDARH